MERSCGASSSLIACPLTICAVEDFIRPASQTRAAVTVHTWSWSAWTDKKTRDDTMTKSTTDHDEIKQWAERRDAKPVSVKGTGNQEPGVLRFDFPGYAGADEFEELSWDDWFAKFEENRLAMLYQDEKSGGEQSNFFKLVNREGAEA